MRAERLAFDETAWATLRSGAGNRYTRSPTSMDDLSAALASHVLPQHRTYGYCDETLSSAVALRRHIELSRRHLTALFMQNAPGRTMKKV